MDRTKPDEKGFAALTPDEKAFYDATIQSLIIASHANADERYTDPVDAVSGMAISYVITRRDHINRLWRFVEPETEED